MDEEGKLISTQAREAAAVLDRPKLINLAQRELTEDTLLSAVQAVAKKSIESLDIEIQIFNARLAQIVFALQLSTAQENAILSSISGTEPNHARTIAAINQHLKAKYPDTNQRNAFINSNVNFPQALLLQLTDEYPGVQVNNTANGFTEFCNATYTFIANRIGSIIAALPSLFTERVRTIGNNPALDHAIKDATAFPRKRPRVQAIIDAITPTAPPVETVTPTAPPMETITPTAPPVETVTPTAPPVETVTPTAPPMETITPTAPPMETVTPTAPPVETVTPTAPPVETVTPTAPPMETVTPTAPPVETVTPTAPVEEHKAAAEHTVATAHKAATPTVRKPKRLFDPSMLKAKAAQLASTKDKPAASEKLTDLQIKQKARRARIDGTGDQGTPQPRKGPAIKVKVKTRPGRAVKPVLDDADDFDDLFGPDEDGYTAAVTPVAAEKTSVVSKKAEVEATTPKSKPPIQFSGADLKAGSQKLKNRKKKRSKSTTPAKAIPASAAPSDLASGLREQATNPNTLAGRMLAAVRERADSDSDWEDPDKPSISRPGT